MLFEFNIHSSLLIPSVIQGLLYFILFTIRSKRQENWADFFLALLTFWSACHISNWMLGFAGWYDTHDGLTQFMFYFPFSNWFFLGPLLYFFIKAKTNSNFQLRRIDYPHLIIPGLSFTWVFICFFIDIIWKQSILGETLPQHYGTRGYFAQNPYGPLEIPMEILKHALLFYYIFLSIRHYQQYKSYIVHELSIAEEVDIKWVRNILYAFTIAIVFWFFLDLAGLFFEQSFQNIWWGYLFWGAMIFYISISGFQDKSHLDYQISFDPRQAGKPDTVEEDTVEQVALKQIMTTERYYLKPNLSLNDLAKELKVSAAQLSKMLNSDFNQNFNEFVNEFRINDVIDKFKKEEFNHYSILGIALESGFNSKATFNRVFKSQIGISPSQYRKSILKQS